MEPDGNLTLKSEVITFKCRTQLIYSQFDNHFVPKVEFKILTLDVLAVEIKIMQPLPLRFCIASRCKQIGHFPVQLLSERMCQFEKLSPRRLFGVL